MLSNYLLKIIEFYNISIGTAKKFATKKVDKENYVLHYQNLQLYLRLVLKLKKYNRNQNSISHYGYNHMLDLTHKNN